jgi:SAM-dependent methyltransferase
MARPHITPPLPWTEAYETYRQRALEDLVSDSGLRLLFESGTILPLGHGVGLDERSIEYPWLLSQLPSGRARVLDAGSSLNHSLLLNSPTIADKSLHIVTLAPEPQCFWRQGVSYLFEDLRALPIKDDFYDIVVSISTLEHVGCDNTYYSARTPLAEDCRDDFVLAAREIRRVLKPGGLLLLTVPYGAYQFHGAFQQFDRARLSRAKEEFGKMVSITERFYRYGIGGWQLARDEDCAHCEYVAWVAELMRTGRRPESLSHEPDLAAAARAVACVRMIKA